MSGIPQNPVPISSDSSLNYVGAVTGATKKEVQSDLPRTMKVLTRRSTDSSDATLTNSPTNARVRFEAVHLSKSTAGTSTKSILRSKPQSQAKETPGPSQQKEQITENPSEAYVNQLLSSERTAWVALKSITGQLSRLREQHDSLCFDRDDLQERLREVKLGGISTTQKLRSIEKELIGKADLEAQLKDNEEKISLQEAEIDQLRSDLHEAVSSIESTTTNFNTAIGAYLARIKEQEEKIEKLEASGKELASKNQELEEENDGLRDDKEDLENDIDALNKDLDISQAETERHLGTSEAAELHSDKLESGLEEIRTQIESVLTNPSKSRGPFRTALIDIQSQIQALLASSEEAEMETVQSQEK